MAIPRPFDAQQHTDFIAQLLTWYAQHGRSLPWRTTPANPYHVLVSELMLHQTTIKTVLPYFHRFIKRWPTLKTLASASVEEVLHAWQGLGYYRRARALHQTACIILQQGGQLPTEEAALRTLPGIGPYTAAALCSIAFQTPAAAVDGNVKRVFARLFCLSQTGPPLLTEVHTRSLAFVQHTPKPGDYTQALMDLGATVCTPTSPTCTVCPLQSFCQSAAHGTPSAFPMKPPKKPLPTRYGHFFWLQHKCSGHWWMEQEQERLLHGLFRPPRSAFTPTPQPPVFPLEAIWKHVGHVQHTFTHFKLSLDVWQGTTDHKTNAPATWVTPDTLQDLALSTLTRKALSYLMPEKRCA